MLHLQRLAGEFFARLEKLDQMIAAGRFNGGRRSYQIRRRGRAVGGSGWMESDRRRGGFPLRPR
jgi:hypothetical protein